MGIVSSKDLVKASPFIQYFGGEYFAKFLMHLLRFNELNTLYEEIGNKSGIEFIDALIDYLDIRLEFNPQDLERIPATGGFITVSNHPFGGIDGILLIKLMSMARDDQKVLANFLLKKVKPIGEYFFAVNPFENMPEAGSSVSGMKAAFDHINEGGVLSIFPAGEVSTKYNSANFIADREWLYPAIKFIRKADVPVVPIFFHGTNSRMFHWLGRIHPTLRTARLASELLNKKGKTIKVRIGNPIPVKEQHSFTDIHQYGRYLRSKTYCLDTGLEVKRFFNYSLKRKTKPEEIIAPASKEAILEEVRNLHPDFLLFDIKNYSIYCAPSEVMPNILHEIGRLREITFREVGEGTNRATDLDEFDLYYNQMFIWDRDEEKIVGAYRIGKGADIIRQFGVQGFYTQSLFRMKKGFKDTLNQSLELGRSFIVKEYQRKPLPLFLLWKGILYFLLRNPEYRYLLGPVSISNTYSEKSKELIIRYIMANFYDYKSAKHIRPRNRHKVTTLDENLNVALENLTDDIRSLDKFIGDIDEYNKGLPVLLKKYLGLNAKIIGFNVDPKFNNCLDGLIILDLFDVPQETIVSLSKEANDMSILERFYSNTETDKAKE
ncbi:lysophospholipid acyltransferase family protein [Prolixibacter sp. NT017]|uniref:lysophospholipid acyltransferase family protein n=1 Tax=Prolixibacter sp. NT017 TaxID=2652390 RepID=UPI00126FC54F|nr:GNAT family N-acyltransferase [Prolixibacter sp. NT017]GET26162.1 glycerol acyltransferase [Prolixibacter sp. NT017]